MQEVSFHFPNTAIVPFEVFRLTTLQTQFVDRIKLGLL